MMKDAFAVIGAGYGDEGKGLATDFLTRIHTSSWDSVPMVARGNGGAQAGHRVVTAGGEEHVFSHIGSGTFADADTYLARNFIINPFFFAQEVDKLKINVNRISAHAGCRITTVFDMALNALREIARGNARHGSCGMGINETVNRDSQYPIRLVDVCSLSIYTLALRLEKIHEAYWSKELSFYSGLSENANAQPWLEIMQDTDFLEHARKMKFIRNIRMAHPYDPPGEIRPLIVEGAQGLMLDEHLGAFPHVTRSITGLPSAILAAHELGYKAINPLYVTRAYATRHGAGNLHGEGKAFTNNLIPAEPTNPTSMWQGAFRYAPLSISGLADFIKKDMDRSVEVAKLLGVEVKSPCLMITCMDHLGDKVATRRFGGDIVWTSSKDLPALIERETGIDVKYLSYGPTAHHIHTIK